MPPDSKTVVAYLARHGRTSLNASGKFRGNADPHLDPTGVKEAHKLAEFFEPIEISYIFCSDKHRAVQTADIVAKTKKIKVHQVENLRALDVGDFSGTDRTPESEAKLQTYLDDPDTPIPGGESLNQFKQRILPCIQEAVDLFCDCGVPPLVVVHSSVIHEIGSLTASNHKAVLVEPGGVVAVYFSGGKLKAEPILKPVKTSGSQAETIT